MIGCGAPPRANTTFLGSVDLIAMTDAMAGSFAAHPTISARHAGSPPWVISMDRVTNHTNQIIPEREKWLYVARLRAALGVSRLADERAITWIMPPERWALVQDELGPVPPQLRLTPTHVLAATFAALTNTSGRGRSDAYLCEYQLIDLATGSVVWNDAWEVKRAQSGVTYD